MQNFKKDFPIFQNNPGLVYLDNAATTQKPEIVINAIKYYLEHDNSNIHRGRYSLAERSEDLYLQSKDKVAANMGVKPYEVIYTYNSTYALNLLVLSLARSGFIKENDKVLLPVFEHHANIVPWMILKEDYKIDIEFINLTSDFDLDYIDFQKKYDHNVKIVSCTRVSNVTGSIIDLKKLKSLLRNNTLFIVDASQAAPNFALNIPDIGCDACVFTAHKMMASTGLGILRGKKDLLKKIDPAIGGGGAISDVQKTFFSFGPLPEKFESGTPNILGAVSLLKAYEYIESIGGFNTIMQQENKLISYSLEKFKKYSDKITLIGKYSSENRLGVFSFVLTNKTKFPYIAEQLAQNNVCIRCGSHCAYPLTYELGYSGTCRMSLYFYNDYEDIDRFFAALAQIW